MSAGLPTSDELRTSDQRPERVRRGRAAGPAPGSVVVRVPATSANLGPGFDSLGLALDLWDTYTVAPGPVVDGLSASAGHGPCSVEVEGEGAGTVAADDANLVVTAMRAAAAHAGASLPAFALHCENCIPHGRGLGSSAAAIVGGVLAGRALAGLPRDPPAELELAAALEGHPDNVAAALLGGLTVAWCTRPGARAIGLTPVGLRVRVFVPPAAMSTRTARGLLPTQVPHADAAHAAGRSALLVAALTVVALPDRRAALLAGTEDRLHQAVRGRAMPVSEDLLGRLRAAGIAAVLSGSGPAVLAVAPAAAAGGDWAEVAVPASWTVLDLAVASGASCRVHAAAEPARG